MATKTPDDDRQLGTLTEGERRRLERERAEATEAAAKRAEESSAKARAMLEREKARTGTERGEARARDEREEARTDEELAREDVEETQVREDREEAHIREERRDARVREREAERSEGERELDDLDAVPGPDQDLNMTLENLPEEIHEADERYDLDPTTMQAETSIFKLAALIAGIVIAILLVVAVIWIF